jgi:AraC family transcriptional regulator
MHSTSPQLHRAGVSILKRQNSPGSVILPPAGDHRIVVHLSPATHTVCRDSLTTHIRRKGDIDVIPAGLEGGYDAEESCEAWEICLSPKLLLQAADRTGIRMDLQVRHVVRNDRIVHLARALDSDRAMRGTSSPLYAEGIGIALAVQLLGAPEMESGNRPRLSKAQLQRVFDFIDANLDSTLTIDVLAREAGASASHLRLWFKAATGLTIHRYLVRRRVEKAEELLRNGSLPASEIALACGFSHQSHMAHWMRRELGFTPRQLSGCRVTVS